MSKQFKKFRKNDYYDDDNENFAVKSNYIQRKTEKRVDRALKTKDISALIEDEETDYAYDSIYDEMADEDSWPDEREEYH
jgi:DNA-binding transcriptional regulator GbsR (MarR family)